MTLPLEEGDTGEAILPVPVSAIAARLNASRVETEKANGVGVHADRDGSEAREARLAPRGDNPSTSLPTARDAENSVTEWTEADRLRLELGRTWALYFEARRDAEAAEAKLARIEKLLEIYDAICMGRPGKPGSRERIYFGVSCDLHAVLDGES